MDRLAPVFDVQPGKKRKEGEGDLERGRSQ